MTKLKHLQPLLLRNAKYQFHCIRFLSRSQDDGGSSSESTPNSKSDKKKVCRPMYTPEVPSTIDELEEPTTCCMSGCANCVWIEYAEKLSQVLKDSPGDVQKLIMEKVQDPNMRAFLSMELRTRNLINK
ncbi:hypothetical protein QAD02_006011 [Eretmocerus hayati]|uniref:Uncharacterized protein n=1 Tax=Eretmocerus hayati TaxID=131215 RepID=A0ACC2N049_9HYME|nr:hypothetical protein QAD02_006011 [Eretmocerus hayati]